MEKSCEQYTVVYYELQLCQKKKKPTTTTMSILYFKNTLPQKMLTIFWAHRVPITDWSQIPQQIQPWQSLKCFEDYLNGIQGQEASQCYCKKKNGAGTLAGRKVATSLLFVKKQTNNNNNKNSSLTEHNKTKHNPTGCACDGQLLTNLTWLSLSLSPLYRTRDWVPTWLDSPPKKKRRTKYTCSLYNSLCRKQ